MRNTNIEKDDQNQILDESFLDSLFLKKKDLSEGYFSYNLGVYNFSKKNYGMSLYHFEKSKALSFFDENLNEKSKIGINEVHKIIKINKVDHFSKGMEFFFQSYNLKTEVSLIFLILLLLIIFFKSKMQKLGYTVLLMILAGFMYFSWITIANNYSVGIILKKSNIFIGPSMVYSQKRNVRVGQKILVNRDHFGGWYRIIYPASCKGWVQANNIGIF